MTAAGGDRMVGIRLPHPAAGDACRAAVKRQEVSLGLVTLCYGLGCYLAFLAAFAYLTAFLGDLGVPRSVSVGPDGPAWLAGLLDTALLAGFGVQHSLMARPGFKRAWTRIVPPAAERSTYVLLSSLALGLLFLYWRPIPERVWNLGNPMARFLVWTVFAAGILIALLSTFMISHAQLFGLSQAWFRFRGRPCPERPFTTVGFYRHVRHPLMTGFLLAFWAAPSMTCGRLLFAAVGSGYILAGTWLEERELLRTLGPAYQSYRQRVPMFFPAPWRRQG